MDIKTIKKILEKEYNCKIKYTRKVDLRLCELRQSHSKFKLTLTSGDIKIVYLYRCWVKCYGFDEYSTLEYHVEKITEDKNV